ncbi:MAG: hypothetical protein KDC87_18785 [Planctomycetes bacterium]|nr:hypothetical protein [Planctomycetota bacterium]MCB9868242.1 hypothetical protein [Planctomycetota bacterium]
MTIQIELVPMKSLLDGDATQITLPQAARLSALLTRMQELATTLQTQGLLTAPSGPNHLQNEQFKEIGSALFALAKAAPVLDPVAMTSDDDLEWGVDPETGLPSVRVPGELEWTYPAPGFSMPIFLDDAARAVAGGDGSAYELFLSIHGEIPQPPNQHTCTYCLRNGSGATVEGVALIFAHTRTQVLSIVPQGNAAHRHNLPADSETARFFGFEAKVPPNQTVCFAITFTGDPPHIRGAVWLDHGEAPQVAGQDVSPFGPLPRIYPYDHAEDLLKYAPSFTDEMDFVHASIEARPEGETKDFRRFFFHLDRATMPNNAAMEPALKKAVIGLGAYLHQRFYLRGQAFASDIPFATPVGELDSWHVHVERVAREFSEVLHGGFFGDPLDLHRIYAAFHAFAAGDLIEFATHGAPNGVNYFAFAEFALLLLDVQKRAQQTQRAFAVDAQLWKDLVPVFCGSAEVFVRTFHRRRGARQMCEYRVDRGGSGRPAPPVRDIQKRWSGDFAGKFGQLIATALADEMNPQPDLARRFDLS